MKQYSYVMIRNNPDIDKFQRVVQEFLDKLSAGWVIEHTNVADGTVHYIISKEVE